MRHYTLDSTPATHYTTAIAANGGVETESFPGMRADGYGKIEGIRIKSKQNLAWQVEIMNDAGEPLYFKRFAATDATSYIISGSTDFYYSCDATCPIPNLTNATLTIGIRNLSDTAKTVDADGYLTLTLFIEK